MEINKILSDIRHDSRMSRDDLAKKSGVSITYIYQIEKEDKNPTIKFVMKLLNAMGYTLKIVPMEVLNES